MINISFYLLTPKAKNQSNLYISLTANSKRERFFSGYSFDSNFCNSRKNNRSRDLVKRNSPLYFEYQQILSSIQSSILKISHQVYSEKKQIDLAEIRSIYLNQNGQQAKKPEKEESFISLYDSFLKFSDSEWSYGTYQHFIVLKNHITQFEEKFGKLKAISFNTETWKEIRDDYFVKHLGLGNSTINSMLKKLKQFLKYIHKNGKLNPAIDFEELKSLVEIEPFKISLKENEVQQLMEVDLSHNPRLDRVRDLFALEIFTGQRFSDISKMLDPKNINEEGITIYQQKTNERVFIPAHPKLKSHLKNILAKYGNHYPEISNQKFNAYLKEIFKELGFNQIHTWEVISGKTKTQKSDYRYNLIGSHTGRRTFSTLALKNGIPAEIIMKISGHKKYDQFKEYVKVDDHDIHSLFKNVFF